LGSAAAGNDQAGHDSSDLLATIRPDVVITSDLPNTGS
jgi:hypothetical protein